MLSDTEKDCIVKLKLTGYWGYSGSLNKAQRLAVLHRLIQIGFVDEHSCLPTALADEYILNKGYDVEFLNKGYRIK